MASVFHEQCKACGAIRECRKPCLKCNVSRMKQSEVNRECVNNLSYRKPSLIPAKTVVAFFHSTISDVPVIREREHQRELEEQEFKKKIKNIPPWVYRIDINKAVYRDEMVVLPTTLPKVFDLGVGDEYYEDEDEDLL